ncbi:MAG: TonB-dependent receptor [Bacteroidota bacterium]
MLGFILSFDALAQKNAADTTTLLNEVVITNTRLQAYAIGHYVQRVDSLTSKLSGVGNAAELFRKFGFGHIRSYGVGGLTTPSFRGTGASHTAILWNGINIISPLNGQSDLTLLPVTFIDDVQLQSGGSASLYGSGAIGGTIQFNNKAVFNQGLNVSLTENAGSFKTFFHGLSASYSSKRFITSTKVFQASAENNFPFLNDNFNPPKKDVRQHDAIEQHGVLQQNYFQINQRQLLSLRFWYQDNHVEIPEIASVTIPGKSTQRDQFFRSMIGWNYDYKNGHLFVQSAQVHHMLDYRNPNTNTVSITTFNSIINTFENTVDLGNDLEWTSGANYTYEDAIDVRSRNRFALYTAFKQQSGKWQNVLSARQETVNGKLTPFAPSFGLQYDAFKVLSFFGNVSRNYRIPTFNDLYWNDATAKGNPDLKMETSWSEEAGLKLNWIIQGQLALFSNQVDEMIYWTQTAGKWSPQNLHKAWTRGLESMGTYRKTFGKVSGELTVRYSYTLATNEDGKDLVFTPHHESGTTLRLGWRSYYFSVTNNYTGFQYTDESNDVLKAYDVANAWLSKDLSFKKLTMMFMIEMNNMFNSQVSTRPGYPLPGRNFKGGLTIRFNKPINQK